MVGELIAGMSTGTFFRETSSYRIAVDETGVGSIRILKRINFKTFIQLFRELFVEMKKVNPGGAHVVFYVSRSLHDEMSDNTREFMNFCNVCLNATFELVIVE